LGGRLQLLGSNELVMYKPRWGAFYQTSLEAQLRALDVNTLVLCGCNFPNCPRTTMYEASERDFRVMFVTDATSGVYPQGLGELVNIGVCLQTAEECERWLAS
jgi:nicotinamidase-related amidase